MGFSAAVLCLFVHVLGKRSVQGWAVPIRLSQSLRWPSFIDGPRCFESDKLVKRELTFTALTLMDPNDGDQSPTTEQLDKDPDAPKKWNDETSPLEIVQYYADNVTDYSHLSKLLDEFQITSLPKLEQDFALLGSFLKRGSSGEILRNILAALNRTATKPVEILGGKLIYDPTCIDKESLALFSQDAVSVNDGDPDRKRTPNFTLVLGPSGSGKTMFALKRLPNLIFPSATEEQILRIHIKATTLLLRSNSDEDADLPALLVAHVQSLIAAELSTIFGLVVPPPIDLNLLVVIDEAGSSELKRYFDEASKVENLVTA